MKITIYIKLFIITIIFCNSILPIFGQSYSFNSTQILKDNGIYNTSGDYSFQLDSNDIAHIAYSTRENYQSPIKICYNNNSGGTFSNEAILAFGNDSVTFGSPHILVDSNRNIHLLFLESTYVYDNNWNVKFHKSRILYSNNIGGNFMTPINICPTDSLYIGEIYFRIDNSNNIHVVYSAAVSANNLNFANTLYYTCSSQSSFNSPIIIADSLTSWNFTFEVDKNYKIHVFSQYDPVDYLYGWNVGYWCGDYNSGFSNVNIIDSNANNDAWSVQMVHLASCLDNQGYVHIVYESGGHFNYELNTCPDRGIRYTNNRSGSFDTPITIVPTSSKGGSGGGAYSLISGVNGIHLVYSDNNNNLFYTNNIQGSFSTPSLIMYDPFISLPSIQFDKIGYLNGFVSLYQGLGIYDVFYFKSNQIIDHNINSNITTNILSYTKDKFTVYPNLVNNFLYINNLTKNETFSLTDAKGHIIIKKIIYPNEIVDLTNITPGVYIVKINNRVISYKIIKK